MPDSEDLQAQLDAARRTIQALVARVERYQSSTAARDREATLQAMAHLEAIVEQRSRELATSESQYRTLFDSSPDLLVTVNTQGSIMSVNATLRHALDADSDVLGQPLSSLFETDSANIVRDRMRAVLDRGEEIELVLRDGRAVTCIGAEVAELHGGYLVIIRDISARQRLEEALQNARRLASLGHLAAGVAHEINNPLAVIQGRAELALLDATHLSPAHREAFEVMVSHSERIARIVRNLRAFSGPGTGQREVVALTEVLKAAEASVPALGGLALDVGPELTVEVERWQVERAFTNLFQSALDTAAGPVNVKVHARQSGGRIHVEVLDDGPGIDPALIEKILTPFATGTTPQVRSGLGLSITWGILQEHGSTLEIDNPDDGGALFRFTLPAASVSAPAAPMNRVLVVEDEEQLARNIQSLLAASGYEAVITSSAEAALQQLHLGWDCVLADIRLPGTSGVELLRQIKRSHPELAPRVVLMSGLFQEAPPDTAYLQKPFRGPQLIEAVENATTR